MNDLKLNRNIDSLNINSPEIPVGDHNDHTFNPSKNDTKMDQNVSFEKLFYKCDKCTFITFSKEYLSSHQSETISQCPHIESTDQIHCLGCSNTFFSTESFKAHLLYDHRIITIELKIFLNVHLQNFDEKSENSLALKHIATENEDNEIYDSTGDGDNLFTSENESKEPVEVLNHITIVSNITDYIKESSKLKESKEKKSKLKEIPDQKLFKCTINGCKIRTKSDYSLQIHIKAHNGDQYTCSECLQSFITWRSLRKHLWLEHKIDIDLYSCDLCNYKTLHKSVLNNCHKRIHSDQRSFLCDECPKAFKNARQLSSHKTLHKLNYLQRNFTCGICSRSFASKRLLTGHEETVHQGVKRHLCNYCGYKTNSIGTLNVHLRRKHIDKNCPEKIIPRKCDLCDFTTTVRDTLREHKLKEHTMKYQFKCLHCNYSSIQHSNLKKHVEAVHQRMRRYLCNFCEYKTNSKTMFSKHQRRKHIEEKQLRCDHCNYITPDRNALRDHKFKHRNNIEYPFKCSECTYSSVRKNTLKMHVRRKHPSIIEQITDVKKFEGPEDKI